MLRALLFGVPVVALLLALTNPVSGQFQKGESVVVTEKAELRVPGGTTDTVARGNRVSVDAVNGKWLWVKRERNSKPGWIDSAKVIKYDKATNFFSEQIRKNPADAEAYYARGKQYSFITFNFNFFSSPSTSPPRVKSRTKEEALADYNEAIRLGYKTSDIYTQRAFLHIFIDEVEDGSQSLRDLNEAIRLDPKNVEAYGYRQGILQALGENAKCLADISTILLLEPQEPSAHTTLAMFRAGCADAKFRSGQQAVSSATKACELSKWKDAEALDALAAAWAESGNFAKAIEYSNKALAKPHHSQKQFEERLALYKEKKPYRLPTEEELKKADEK